MSRDQADELIERGLQAWTAGAVDALEAILDPAVTLTWVEPGFQCVNRDEVMQLLRERHAEHDPQGRVSITRVDKTTFVVSTEAVDRPEPFPVATRVKVANGLVVELQQYRTNRGRAHLMPVC